MAAFALAMLLTTSTLAQQTKQAPTPKAPASQGNQPAKPGPAQKTAREAAPAQAQPWKQIQIPPLPAFHPAIPKRVELPNGMIAFLQEDHELPLITVMARARGGSRLEPAAKVGMVDVYGEVWRTGGTTTRTGDQMDDYLEARAAKIETDSGVDSTAISMNCLKGDFNDVFALFLDLLRNPAFREDKIALAQNQMYAVISRRNDDVSDITAREARFLAYGKDNPYARIPEYATVAAITRQDLVNWHQQFVQPNIMILGVVGDFDAAQMEARLRQAFGSWPKGPAAPQPEIKFNTAAPGYYYVTKEDVNQTSVRMVALGIERNNPDYFAISVMNEIFGGGMSSRLFKNIRTRQGLAYSVGGGIGAAFDHPGMFRLALATKSESTAQAIKSLDEQVVELLKDPATPEELRRAKDAILNSFIFSIDTPDKVLSERMSYEFYGYPLDFLERFRAGVEKVSIADVARVAHKYVKPGMFAVLVVGNNEAGKLLATLGPVKTIDIAIPAPPRAAGR
jgi:zinc protease